MAEVTGIAWCDSTFNPFIGCTKVGPGCDNCYAEALMDKRYHRVKWGAGQPRMRTSAANWRKPLAWNKKAEASGKPWRVFCASLADVFDNEVPQEWRWDLYELIDRTPALTWLLLTKRIGNAQKMLPLLVKRGVMSNVWLGATIVNAEEAERDVPKLLATPAAKRFVSYEPALGPVDWTKYPGLDWIIVGGESGTQARRFDWDWARNTIAHCREIGAAPFMKQTGTDLTALYERVQRDRNGADPAEWPEDLRVQEFPA